MEKISADEVKARLDRGEPVVFIDARSQDSWEHSDVQIPGSIRVPPDRADEFVGTLAPDAAIITYCT